MKDNPNRILQYVMLTLLLAAAFLLPRYALWKQETQSTAALSAGQEAQSTAALSAGQETQNADSLAAATEQGNETAAGEAKGTIVIDAGHGGFDSGMVGESGISEKVLNLVYAKKLEALLQAAGYEVVQTRDSEDGLYDENESNKKAQDMQRRCAVIEEAAPLLTVSIHQNSYPQDASVCGPQVFYYEQSSQGEKLAQCIQDRLNTELEIARPRLIKGNSSYYILKRSASTTVIVECGFLTNPQEEAKLQEESYQDALVQAICDGVLDYLSQSSPGTA